MEDYFQLLGIERRPHLDPEVLKQKYLQLSTQAHPDKQSQIANLKSQIPPDAAMLNRGYECLRNPRERVRHLLELEGIKPHQTQSLPTDTMDLVMNASELCRKADIFIAERKKLNSPILQAQMFAKALEWSDTVEQMKKRFEVEAQELESKVHHLDAAWNHEPGNRAALVNQLWVISGKWIYLERWIKQLNERWFNLTA